jgi:hypothetical protein
MATREQRLSQYVGIGRSACFSPDGQTLATTHQNGLLILWDPVKGARMRSWQLPGPADVAFAADGWHLLTANANGTVYVLRLTTRQPDPAAACGKELRQKADDPRADHAALWNEAVRFRRRCAAQASLPCALCHGQASCPCRPRNNLLPARFRDRLPHSGVAGAKCQRRPGARSQRPGVRPHRRTLSADRLCKKTP